MNMVNVSNIIEKFDILSLEEKEYTIDIILKNSFENRRDEILNRANIANDNYSKNFVKEGSIKDLYEDLELA
jgi:hypothetical protein